ncbi:hypothetical protein RUM43_003021 [Polyplax serrata]|uniref:C-type lectin domain-containing protein n=1 Tax=Polyplax serrata TaxID=468196 RepID=A0AAN8NUL0_POLSC
MYFLRVGLVILLTIEYANLERIRLDAKKLLRGKVVANGFSIQAKSLSHCIDHCNRRKKTCDGVVFHEIIEKCRLIYKCAPAYQIDNSSSVVYYSRRPQILVPGYIYETKSDTCVGLVNSNVNYASADELCRKQNSNLAVITQNKLNQLAGNLLNQSGIKWAWIDDGNIAQPATIKPHGMSGNDVLSEEAFSPEIVQWRNNTRKSCWGLNNRGQWGQFSCKNDTLVALCQVRQFID